MSSAFGIVDCDGTRGNVAEGVNEFVTSPVLFDFLQKSFGAQMEPDAAAFFFIFQKLYPVNLSGSFPGVEVVLSGGCCG